MRKLSTHALIGIVVCLALMMAAPVFPEDPQCYWCRGLYYPDGSHFTECASPDDGSWGSSSCSITTLRGHEICQTFGSGCFYIVVTP